MIGTLLLQLNHTRFTTWPIRSLDLTLLGRTGSLIQTLSFNCQVKQLAVTALLKPFRNLDEPIYLKIGKYALVCRVYNYYVAFLFR